MEIRDLYSMLTGMMGYDRLLKKLGTNRRENALMAYRHQIPKTVPNVFVDVAMMQACPQLERYCGMEEGEDMWGVHWKYVPSANAPMTIEGNIMLEDIADWREVVKFPDLEAIDWKAQAEKDLHTDWAGFVSGKGLQTTKKSCLSDGQACLVMVINGPFERMHSLMGFQNALMALAEDPESCYEFVGAVTDFKIAYFRKIKEYYPVDIINAHDDYGSKDRPFMSLETWRSIFKPHLKRLVDAVHEMGLIYQHHSCGYVENLIPDLVEIGVDAIDPLQGGSNRNLVELKKKYGRQITFVGGFDNQGVFDLPGTTAKQVHEEYRKVIHQLAPGGSYVSFPNGANADMVAPCLAEHFRTAVKFYTK